MIISQLAVLNQVEKVRFINVEDGNYLVDKLTEIGFENFVNQYEMKLEL